MKVDALTPRPMHREGFRRNCERFLPDRSGCYALTTFDGTILYVGLTVGLRRRMIEHLDTPAKVTATALGRAVWFYWMETTETNKVERTWMNIHLLAEGKLPILNGAYSPISI